jgi:hypothetical protein
MFTEFDQFEDDFNIDLSAPKRPMGDIANAIVQHVESCKACRGTGRFISYSGRAVGPCFKCKGKGKLSFKLSPEKRAAGRQYAANAAVRKQDEARSAAATFAEQNPAAVAWINAKRGSFDFATAMSDTLNKYGHLTENQLNAVLRCVVRDEERAAANVARIANVATNAPAINVLKIVESFAHAMSKGIKRPKLRLDAFKFSVAPATGRNAGSIYVVQDEIYLGKITDGKFFRARDCSDEQQDRIVAAAANPGEAAKAYGFRTGSCSCCGRELTNKASIDLGIGPICADKYGF